MFKACMFYVACLVCVRISNHEPSYITVEGSWVIWVTFTALSTFFVILALDEVRMSGLRDGLKKYLDRKRPPIQKETLHYAASVFPWRVEKAFEQ